MQIKIKIFNDQARRVTIKKKTNAENEAIIDILTKVLGSKVAKMALFAITQFFIQFVLSKELMRDRSLIKVIIVVTKRVKLELK